MTNEPLAVIWDEVEGRKWYIGFYLDENEDGTFRIDHLKRAKENGIEVWERISGPGWSKYYRESLRLYIIYNIE